MTAEPLTAADYEEVLADHRRLVRELDVLLNGEGAAKQASLCDIVGQLRAEKRNRPSENRCTCFDGPASREHCPVHENRPSKKRVKYYTNRAVSLRGATSDDVVEVYLASDVDADETPAASSNVRRYRINPDAKTGEYLLVDSPTGELVDWWQYEALLQKLAASPRSASQSCVREGCVTPAIVLSNYCEAHQPTPSKRHR